MQTTNDCTNKLLSDKCLSAHTDSLHVRWSLFLDWQGRRIHMDGSHAQINNKCNQVDAIEN